MRQASHLKLYPSLPQILQRNVHNLTSVSSLSTNVDSDAYLQWKGYRHRTAICLNRLQRSSRCYPVYDTGYVGQWQWWSCRLWMLIYAMASQLPYHNPSLLWLARNMFVTWEQLAILALLEDSLLTCYFFVATGVITVTNQTLDIGRKNYWIIYWCVLMIAVSFNPRPSASFRTGRTLGNMSK